MMVFVEESKSKSRSEVVRDLPGLLYITPSLRSISFLFIEITVFSMVFVDI